MVTIEEHYNTASLNVVEQQLSTACIDHDDAILLPFCHNYGQIFRERDDEVKLQCAARANVLELRIIHTVLSYTKIQNF